MCDESLAEKYDFHIADLKNKDMVDVNYMDRYGNTGQYSFEEQYICASLHRWFLMIYTLEARLERIHLNIAISMWTEMCTVLRML